MLKKFNGLKLFITVLLVFSVVLSACSSGTTGDQQASPSGNHEENHHSGESEPYEITVAFLAFQMPKEADLVAEEISKITKEKFNATVNLIPLSPSAFNQQRNLMLSGQQKLDLIFVNGQDYSSLVSRGQLLPLNDLIEKHGQGVKEVLGNYLEAARIDGEIYAIPSVRDFAASYGIIMRKDLVDKYDIDVASIQTLDDVEEVLHTIKMNEPHIEPLVSYSPGRSILEGYVTVDFLSDGLGVLPNYDNDLQVVNYYEMPEYVELLKRLRKWYENGYIVKDIATTQSTKAELIQADRTFAYFEPLKPGIEGQNTRTIGQEMVAAELVPPVSTTEIVTRVMFAIARNSQDPERTMMFVNEMYTNPDITNLLAWGIEGRHYEVKYDNIIGYPEGVDASNTGYGLNQGWMFGNQFLNYIWEGDDPDLWEQTAAFNDKAIKSKALGFIFDSYAVRTEVAAVTNVLEQYKLGLETGTLDPDQVYDEFIAKLKDAGIDTIIAEKQKQLDEWASKNN